MIQNKNVTYNKTQIYLKDEKNTEIQLDRMTQLNVCIQRYAMYLLLSAFSIPFDISLTAGISEYAPSIFYTSAIFEIRTNAIFF